MPSRAWTRARRQEVRTMHALDHKNVLHFYAWAIAGVAPLKDKVNVLSYFETLCVDTNAANMLINSSLCILFIRMLRKTRAPTLRIRLASVLGLLVCHATYIAEELAQTNMIDALSEALKDRNERVRRRVMATLVELLFYTKQQDGSANTGTVAHVSDCWNITGQTIGGVTRLLKSTEDEIAQHHAVKTIENICSQGGEWVAKTATQDAASNLLAQVSRRRAQWVTRRGLTAKCEALLRGRGAEQGGGCQVFLSGPRQLPPLLQLDLDAPASSILQLLRLPARLHYLRHASRTLDLQRTLRDQRVEPGTTVEICNRGGRGGVQAWRVRLVENDFVEADVGQGRQVPLGDNITTREQLQIALAAAEKPAGTLYWRTGPGQDCIKLLRGDLPDGFVRDILIEVAPAGPERSLESVEDMMVRLFGDLAQRLRSIDQKLDGMADQLGAVTNIVGHQHDASVRQRLGARYGDDYGRGATICNLGGMAVLLLSIRQPPGNVTSGAVRDKIAAGLESADIVEPAMRDLLESLLVVDAGCTDATLLWISKQVAASRALDPTGTPAASECYGGASQWGGSRLHDGAASESAGHTSQAAELGSSVQGEDAVPATSAAVSIPVQWTSSSTPHRGMEPPVLPATLSEPLKATAGHHTSPQGSLKAAATGHDSPRPEASTPVEPPPPGPPNLTSAAALAAAAPPPAPGSLTPVGAAALAAAVPPPPHGSVTPTGAKALAAAVPPPPVPHGVNVKRLGQLAKAISGSPCCEELSLFLSAGAEYLTLSSPAARMECLVRKGSPLGLMVLQLGGRRSFFARRCYSTIKAVRVPKVSMEFDHIGQLQVIGSKGSYHLSESKGGVKGLPYGRKQIVVCARTVAHAAMLAWDLDEVLMSASLVKLGGAAPLEKAAEEEPAAGPVVVNEDEDEDDCVQVSAGRHKEWVMEGVHIRLEIMD